VILTKKIVFDFIIKYWKELLLIILLVVIFIHGRMSYSSLYKVHLQTIEQYETRLEQMDKAYKEQLRKKDEAIKLYIERVENLRDEYDSARQEAESKRESRRNYYEKTFEEKPKELILEIEDKFGFKYVE